jgi:hypothetical protein
MDDHLTQTITELSEAARLTCVSPLTVSILDDAAKRWAGVGPYYAMMPTAFVLEQISRFTEPGDAVLDPFCGRGTIPFAAGVLGRSFFGVEIFPVGWVYAAAKCNPASERKITKRLDQIAKDKPRAVENSDFFRMAFAPNVLKFLCAAREQLDWKSDPVDRTLIAIILICLHDKSKIGLSNQMRQTKAVHPDYAVRWWRRKYKTAPPKIDPVEMLKNKIKWRYAKGRPKLEGKGKIYFGDCTKILSRESRISDVKLLFTSPPYYEITNYFVDQWLRNWLLGGPPRPCSGNHPYMKRFDNKDVYRQLLNRAFKLAATKLRPDAVVLVRTDAREFTLKTTREVLANIFPEKDLLIAPSRLKGRLSQTALFGDKQKKPGEIDMLLTPAERR